MVQCNFHKLQLKSQLNWRLNLTGIDATGPKWLITIEMLLMNNECECNNDFKANLCICLECLVWGCRMYYVVLPSSAHRDWEYAATIPAGPLHAGR